MSRDFRRIAIINRGEAATRLIHAVRELNREHGTSICSIALHTSAERQAMFVREADEAICLDDLGPSGPLSGHALGSDARATSTAASPYLDYSVLERALVACSADAAWPGWGFVAEHAQFAELCERLGATFIGPSPVVTRRLGDKIAAKLLAEEAGVPVAPWSGGPVPSIREARRHARLIGYPLVVKATSGGGGRGIRRATSDGDLAEAFEAARSEAAKSFGDPTVFMERMVTAARHVEVQVVGDEAGTIWVLGVRDCTIQRRNQKVIEESRSTALTVDQESELGAAASRMCRLAGYRSAGTVEFLYQPEERLFSFLEVNTRLQVEHPVTEVTTGLDLVKLQLHVARGGLLVGSPPPTFGHAIEARLNAEDPELDFSPSPGVIELFTLPNGPGVRVDTGVAEGDVISPAYDSMIAKVIAWGRDRDEARARLGRALDDLTVVVRGGVTNKSFLLDLLGTPEVVAGRVDTGWLDRLTPADTRAWARHPEVALAAAAIDAYDAEEAVSRVQFLASAARGRPHASPEVGRTIELRHGGQSYRVRVAKGGPHGWYRLEMDARVVDVVMERLSRFRSRLALGGVTHRVVSVIDGADHVVEVDSSLHRLSRDDGGIVRAPAAAVVVSVAVAPGAVVGAGERLVVVESMKMEVAITAAVAGRVAEILVSSNVLVDAGTPLLRLEPITKAGATAVGSRVGFGAPTSPVAPDPHATCRQLLEAMRSFVAGYDLGPEEGRRLLDAYQRTRHDLEDPDGLLVPAELGVLATFADVSALTRNRRDGNSDGEDAAHSPRERFRAFLRSLDADREGLSDRFRTALRRALGHYGVRDLTRTAELEEALYRVFQAQQQSAAHVPVVLGVLEGLAARLDQVPAALRGELSSTLDGLILATQLRHPVVGNLARGVRHRAFDQPVIDRSRAAGYRQARSDLAALASDPRGPGSAERLDRLVASPQPLLALLADRIGDPGAHEPVLELLTRRYYKVRHLEHLHTVHIDGQDLLCGEYVHQQRRVHVVAVRADLSGIRRAAAAAAVLASRLSPEDEIVIDLYCATAETSVAVPNEVRPVSAAGADVGAGHEAAADTAASALVEVLDAAAFPPAVSRVAVALCPARPPAQGRAGAPGGYGADSGSGGGPGAGIIQLTFGNGPDGFTEDRLVRGLHPMITRRLHLWRLANFHLERLVSAPDVYLFDCVARDNPADERLVALAEVRDLTAVRDSSGQVTALPELEQVLAACLDSLRSARSQHPAGLRLAWNRVQLYVWPLVETPIEELLAVAGRLAPITEGLGLDQVVVQCRVRDPESGVPQEMVVRLGSQPGTGLTVRLGPPPIEALRPLDEYTQKVIQAQRRGSPYPYELVPLLCGEGGSFVEHDLDAGGRLVPVARAPGLNTAAIVVGVSTTPTVRYPEGMRRVTMMGDPTKALGSIAEAECRRLLSAIDLAEATGSPVEWFALSSGARIAMMSGSENLDWVGRVLRRIVEFTQAGGEINVIVTGINVGAQPYWNAEATMLMHTSGILVMTPDSAMVLTGKQALDYAGGVSAEDNLGLGGYERIMGPNGEAQYWAADVASACAILFAHYEHAYIAPRERYPRTAPTTDPRDRDVRADAHIVDGVPFTSVGDIFDDETNRDRKKPFDIRTLMHAAIDRDHPPMERWAGMADADTAVVFDAHLGGHPITLLGVESRPLARHGAIPADGPDQWSAGTLFPLSSKKVARAINAASGRRPVVMLANLSGFDGSPESLRRLQLEYGAEIGRAVVNFDGPLVLCVVSRYHGGAFVVFSATLNPRLEVLAVEGSFASVIGGSAAAAVVFGGDVRARTEADVRVRRLEAAISAAAGDARPALRAELAEVTDTVRLEKLGEVAAEFDAIHSVERALEVGSVHRIIAATRLRPELIAAVERGMAGAGS